VSISRVVFTHSGRNPVGSAKPYHSPAFVLAGVDYFFEVGSPSRGTADPSPSRRRNVYAVADLDRRVAHRIVDRLTCQTASIEGYIAKPVRVVALRADEVDHALRELLLILRRSRDDDDSLRIGNLS